MQAFQATTDRAERLALMREHMALMRDQMGAMGGMMDGPHMMSDDEPDDARMRWRRCTPRWA